MRSTIWRRSEPRGEYVLVLDGRPRRRRPPRPTSRPPCAPELEAGADKKSAIAEVAGALDVSSAPSTRLH